jgi:hypothetical protein
LLLSNGFADKGGRPLAIDAIVLVEGRIDIVATAPGENQTVVSFGTRTGARVVIERPVLGVERLV